MYKHLNFKELNLHDCKVYAWGVLPESNKLLIDVDWIISTELQYENFHFHISPSTFVFSNVWDIDIDIMMNMDLTIDSVEIISEQKPRNISVLPKDTKEYTYRINFMEGSFTFKSIDFTIVQRKKELKTTIANLTNDERAGISLLMEGCIYQVSL